MRRFPPDLSPANTPAVATDGLLTLDLAGLIVAATPELERRFGAEAAPLVGRSLGSLLPDVPDLVTALAFAQTGAAVKLTHGMPDGTELVLTLARVVDTDRMVAYVHDTSGTDRLTQVVDAQERLAALGAATTAAANTINNALAATMTLLELLGHPAISAGERAMHLAQLTKEATRATGMVSRLLSLAREGEATPESFDLREAIEESCALVQAPLAAARIQVRTTSTLRTPIVLGRRANVEQILHALLVNAIDAITAREGAGPRAVTCTITEHDADHLALAIADTGGGIAPAVGPRLFDRGVTTKAGHAGMGLARARTLARHNLGTLRVTDDPGVGATFTLTLLTAPEATGAMPAIGSSSVPRASTQPGSTAPTGIAVVRSTPASAERAPRALAMHEAARRTTVPGALASAGALAGCKLLLVDDEAVYRQTTARLLRLYEPALIVEAATADEGLDAVREDPTLFDLVLLDMRLPGKSGREAFLELRAMAPALAGRTIFLLGDRVEGDMQAFLTREGLAYVQKPYRADDLIRVMGDVLTAAAARDIRRPA